MAVYCTYCNKEFSSQTNLNRHRRNVHHVNSAPISYNKYSRWNNKCLEINCDSSFRNNDDLVTHLQQQHSFTIETEMIEVESIEAFNSWKGKAEVEEQCNYRLIHKYKFGLGMEKMIYVCNRSGKYSSDLRQKKRVTKSQGSCKINRSCISRVTVMKKEAKLQITHIKTHYGHEAELQHIRISKNDRMKIGADLLSGVSQGNVLDNVRDHIGKEEKLKRVDLLTRQDVVNIARSFKLEVKNGVRHKIDSISIDLWVQECLHSDSDECPVLLYKKQGSEMDRFEKSDFCLIFMNTYQKMMFHKFGSDIIAIDSTHGLNNYDFELTTIMVVDNNHEGFPVSYMFSNRKDTLVNQIFFEAVKTKLVNYKNCKTFMSDITGTFYDAWVAVMGTVSHQLYCSWHVDRAWRSNLSKISNKEKRTKVYKNLKYLQQSLTENKFQIELHKFIEFLLQDADTTRFGFYFKTYYLQNFESWAYCFRKNCGINTNMYLESMHKSIKYFYLSGRKVKRLDKGLHAVLKYTRDKVVDRLIKCTKGKNSSAIREILKRHQTSLVSKFDIKIIEDNCKWLLRSSGNEYVVTKMTGIEKCCSLVCQHCEICVHAYTCTCPDFYIKSTMCKHVHYVTMKGNTIQYGANELSVESKFLPDEKECILKTLKCTDRSDTDISNTETGNENVKNILGMLASLTYQLSPSFLNQLSSENLNYINKQITNLNMHVESLTDANFKPIINNPALGNQKIHKQDNFISTKKKRTKPYDSLTKPNYVEIQKIQSVLHDHLIDHDYC